MRFVFLILILVLKNEICSSSIKVSETAHIL